MAFVLNKKIDLESVGDNWKNCYVTVRQPSYPEVKKFQNSVDKDSDDSVQYDKTIEFLSSLYIEGKGYNGNEIVSMKKEELADLPMTILVFIINELTGDLGLKEQSR